MGDRRCSLPPGPRGPAALTTAQWLLDPAGLLERAARRYGGPFTLRLHGMGGAVRDVVVLWDPTAVQTVLTGDVTTLHAAAGAMRSLLGRRSVLLESEAAHLARRRILLPAVHGDAIRGLDGVIAETVDQAIDRWPVGRRFELLPELSDVTLTVMVELVFGPGRSARLADLRAEVRAMLDSVSEPTVRLAALRRYGRSWRRFLAARARVDAIVAREIATARRSEERVGAMALLLDARTELGAPLDDRDIRDQLVTLLVAGYEATAAALAWAFVLLSEHPSVSARLEAEAHAGGDAYARAVVRETLRLAPVLPIVVRELTEPFHVADHRLPAGTIVAPCPFLLHRRPDLYPEPQAFRPERFLHEVPRGYTWLPFGGGVRRCLGASLAELEMRLILQRVIRRSRVRTTRVTRPHRRAITLVPGGGTPVVLSRAS
jgi:cytochrome P450